MKKGFGICVVFKIEERWHFEMSILVGNYITLVSHVTAFATKRNAVRSAKNFAKKLNIDVASIIDCVKVGCYES